MAALWTRVNELLGVYAGDWSADAPEARLLAADRVAPRLPPTGWLIRALAAGPLRCAHKWCGRLVNRKRWPLQLLDCRNLPEVAALRNAVRDDRGEAAEEEPPEEGEYRGGAHRSAARRAFERRPGVDLEASGVVGVVVHDRDRVGGGVGTVDAERDAEPVFFEDEARVFAEFHRQGSADYKEKLVFLFMVVPDEFTQDFYNLDMLAVQRTDDPRRVGTGGDQMRLPADGEAALRVGFRRATPGRPHHGAVGDGQLTINDRASYRRRARRFHSDPAPCWTSA